MIATRLVAILATMPGAQDTASYTDPTVNLAFDYPKTWVVSRKGKDSTQFTIPIPDSSEKAELEIVRTPFHSSKEIWQTIQVRVNEQLKRELVRQWEQEVLSVPLLLTQVNYNDKGNAKTTLSGLYYARTPVKLMFKLTAATPEFEKAQYTFQEALQSLRTLDGSEPQEDDENVALTPPKKAPPAPPKRTTIQDNSNKGRTVAAAVDVPMTVSTKPVVMKLPQGWRAEGGEDGKFTLKHDELSGPIQVEVRSTLDSDPPMNALFKLSSASLEQFQSVTKREDTSDRTNPVGCRTSTVLRIGKTAEGDLVVHEACGVQGEFYFLWSYRLTNAAALAAERKLIGSLLEQVSLQPGE